MSASRQKLHTELMLILKSKNVYYQPPESFKMNYPAIVYSRTDIDSTHANNEIYNQKIKYKVTVIDYDPDSQIVEKLMKHRYAVFDRHYAVKGINHDQFTMTYTQK